MATNIYTGTIYNISSNNIKMDVSVDYTIIERTDLLAKIQYDIVLTMSHEQGNYTFYYNDPISVTGTVNGVSVSPGNIKGTTGQITGSASYKMSFTETSSVTASTTYIPVSLRFLDIYLSGDGSEVDKTISFNVPLPESAYIAISCVGWFYDSDLNTPDNLPSTVTIFLLRDGDVIDSQTIDVTTDDIYRYTWSNLPKRNSNGDLYEYSVNGMHINGFFIHVFKDGTVENSWHIDYHAIPPLYVYTNNIWNPTQAYVYHNDKWVSAHVYVYQNQGWIATN